MAIMTLKQAGPIAAWQDPSDPGWYPDVTIVGDPTTAWSDDSDATYAEGYSPSQQQSATGVRGNSPRAEMELAGGITDFTTLTAHVRLRTETNRTGTVNGNSVWQFAIEYHAVPTNSQDDYRFTYDSSSTIEQYDLVLWPAPGQDEETLAYWKPLFLSRMNNGHALNFWSIAGGFQAPTSWWSRVYVYEVWMTVDGVPEPVIEGRPDVARRRFS